MSKVKKSKVHGSGMFATKDIKKNTKITEYIGEKVLRSEGDKWKVKKSKVHGSGIFATKDIKKNTKIIEYIGEKVLRSEGDKRSAKRIKDYLHSEETGSVYIFELNSKYDIDGFFEYNKARYINHSCNPNCEVDIVDGEIWISSIKKIFKGQELTYDYGYEFDKDDYKDHICKCGEKKCIGYIISSDDWKKFSKHISKITKK